MEKYINRLVRCGFSYHRAYYKCYDFIKEYGMRELEDYISFIEKETRINVDRI